MRANKGGEQGCSENSLSIIVAVGRSDAMIDRNEDLY